jgi:hypothetical protein
VLQYFGFQDSPPLTVDPSDTSLTVGSPVTVTASNGDGYNEGGLLQSAKTLIEQRFWGEQRFDLTPVKNTPGKRPLVTG